MLILAIVYIVIASASVFGLIVAADKADLTGCAYDAFDLIGYILGGIFWPFCLLPCAAYIAARWYIKNHNG